MLCDDIYQLSVCNVLYKVMQIVDCKLYIMDT